MNSVPKLRGGAGRLSAIPATSHASALPAPAAVLPRAADCQAGCSEKIPELLEVEPGRFVRCPFYEEQINFTLFIAVNLLMLLLSGATDPIIGGFGNSYQL